MAQLSDDCFVPGEGLMAADAARDMLETRLVSFVETETLPLSACAGRFLAHNLTAARDVPPHDNSAVDGYAIFFDDLEADRETRLPIVGRIAAEIGRAHV